MPSKVLALTSRNVVTPSGVRHAAVLVDTEKGTILGVVERAEVPADTPVEDFGESIIMPGLVDSHVHVNEPGRTEWEGFETATRPGAGGITTIADMPLNSNPVTTTLAAFKEKLDSTRTKLWVDCAFFGGVVPGNTAQLEPMIEAGVVGFKCFLIHSGIDDFPNVAETDLHAAMPVLSRHGVPLLVHAELEHAHNHAAGEKCSSGQPEEWTDSRSYKQFLHSRPRKWEDDAIALMLNLCEKFSCPVHIVHLSSADMLPQIDKALQSKLPFTVETCPHYLTFAAEEIPDGDPRFKCAPPIRERENREKLWGALKQGTVGIVVSDHSPCTPSLKFLSEGDLKKAWGGISSLQFRLPVIWTEAHKRGFSLSDICRWLCEAPADFLGLGERKGRIAAGYDADVVIWDSQAKTVFSDDNIHHKHKVTPYDGREMSGKIQRTYLRGRVIWQDGNHVGTASGGTLLRTKSGVVSV